MTAETLREAARLMRDRAAAMPDWNWTSGHLWITDHDPSDHTGETPMQVPVGGADEPWATHLASWHPDVASAVADLLDDGAFYVEFVQREHPGEPIDQHARFYLALARTYLGEETPR